MSDKELSERTYEDLVHPNWPLAAKITDEDLHKFDNPKGFKRGDVVELQNRRNSPKEVAVIIQSIKVRYWKLLTKGSTNTHAHENQITPTSVNIFELIKIESETQVCNDVKVVCPKCHLIFNILEAETVSTEGDTAGKQQIVMCRRCSKTFYVVNHKYV